MNQSVPLRLTSELSCRLARTPLFGELASQLFVHAQERHPNAAAVVYDAFAKLVAAGAVERFTSQGSHQFDILEAFGTR